MANDKLDVPEGYELTVVGWFVSEKHEVVTMSGMFCAGSVIEFTAENIQKVADAAGAKLGGSWRLMSATEVDRMKALSGANEKCRN